MKKALKSIAVLAFASLALTGCNTRGNSSTSTDSSTSSNTSESSTTTTTTVADGIRVAYTINGYNVIRAEVQVKDGKTTSVHFDEVPFTSDYVALTTTTEGDNIISGDVTSYGSTYTAYRAKYFSYNGTLYTGTYADGAFTFTDANGVNYDTWAKGLTSQADLSDLYYTVVNNYVFGCDSTGAKIDGLTADNYSKASYDSTYWNVEDTTKSIEGSQWKWNIAKIEEALTGKDLTTVSEATADDDSTYVYDGVDTGATMHSFNTYVTLAQTAFLGTSKVVAYYGADKLDSRKSNGHYNCIAKVELVVGDDNTVVDAHINETVRFLEQWGASDAEGTYPTVTYETTTTNYVAQYMVVGDKVWTGTPNTTDTTNKQKVIYSDGTNTDALAYYGNDPYLAADYYNAAFTHHVRIASDASATKTYDPTWKNVTATKAEYANTYWTSNHDGTNHVADGYDTCWKWNIAKVEASFVGVDFTDAATTVHADTANDDGLKTWTINGTETGATMTEYETFATFAHNAYAYLVA